jgi:hypothetical protein
MLEWVKRAVAIVAFACLVSGFGFAVWQASNKAPAQQETNRPSETKNNSQSIPPTGAVPTNQAHAADDHYKRRENKNWLADFFEIKLTDLLIAIFTGVLAWKTAGLFRETEGLRTAADKQQVDFLRSVQATEKAALAAETSAETARTEFVSTHRPRIILREAITGTFLEGQPINVIYHLANVGGTAGTIIKSYVRVETVPRGPIPLLHVSVGQHTELGKIVLGPDKQFCSPSRAIVACILLVKPPRQRPIDCVRFRAMEAPW